MLINFTDTYENYLYEGRQLVGRIVAKIAASEPFVGNSLQLDKFYALSMAITGICDQLEYEDNNDFVINSLGVTESKGATYNEYLLSILKELLSKNLCDTNSEIPHTIIDTMPEPVDLNNLIVNNTAGGGSSPDSTINFSNN
tara:strand:- start:253 stop:678 length:426 start_codon:yes stop_codon:yes gene_type:complete